MADPSESWRSKPRHLRERIEDGDSYSILLALILVTYMLVGIVPPGLWAHVLFSAAFGGVLVLALHTSGVRGRPIRIVTAIVLVVVLFNLTQAAADTEIVRGASYAFILMLAVAPVVVVARVFRHPVVNVETILGAICAYLMIGIFFGALYGAVDRLDMDYFFRQGRVMSQVDFLYYSFVVLTTLGFGDLTPRTDFGKMLTTLEALLGQVFLVTLVAVLVSSFGRRGRTEVSPEDETD